MRGKRFLGCVQTSEARAVQSRSLRSAKGVLLLEVSVEFAKVPFGCLIRVEQTYNGVSVNSVRPRMPTYCAQNNTELEQIKVHEQRACVAGQPRVTRPGGSLGVSACPWVVLRSPRRPGSRCCPLGPCRILGSLLSIHVGSSRSYLGHVLDTPYTRSEGWDPSLSLPNDGRVANAAPVCSARLTHRDTPRSARL